MGMSEDFGWQFPNARPCANRLALFVPRPYPAGIACAAILKSPETGLGNAASKPCGDTRLLARHMRAA